jgi:hypothetical protein
VSVRQDIAENRAETDPGHCVRSADERKCWHDYVAGDLKRPGYKLQADRGAGYRYAVTYSLKFRKALLKLPD